MIEQPDSAASDIARIDAAITEIRKDIGAMKVGTLEYAESLNSSIEKTFREVYSNLYSMAETITALRAEYAELAQRVGIIETDINLIRSELKTHTEMLMAHDNRLTELEAWRQTMTGDGR